MSAAVCEDTPIYGTASQASVWMLWAHDVRVSPERIRQWAQRGKLTRLPTGRARYDLAEVERYALEHAQQPGSGR